MAVASRPAGALSTPTPSDEHGLVLAGFLIFTDRPKADAVASLNRLGQLGIAVKVATRDNLAVAEVCAALGLCSGGTRTGPEIARLDDDALAVAAGQASIFARESPEQKSR